MTSQRFLEQFGYLVDAPNRIAKLRELILQLAVRGKLVPQDPNDEPARVLLEKTRAEKRRLVAEGMIRKARSLPTIVPAEVAYDAPTGVGLGKVFPFCYSGRNRPLWLNGSQV